MGGFWMFWLGVSCDATRASADDVDDSPFNPARGDERVAVAVAVDDT